MDFSYKTAGIVIVSLIIVVGAIVLLDRSIVSKPANQNGASMAAAASLSLISIPVGSVDVGQIEHIQWTSSNYASPTVSLNIIRQVSDDPATYVLVRQVAAATANDGDAVWVPAPGDVGPDTYIQVGCADSAQACTATPLPEQPLAVINDGRYANTASVFQAIEAEYDK